MGRFAAAAQGSGSVSLHPGRRSFSRSYGAVMPSSLTMVPPIASVCSTRPPVSVLVRAPRALPRGFSRERGLRSFAMRLRLASRPRVQGGFACPAAYALSRGRPEPRLRTLLRRPVGLLAVQRRYRNVRLLRIGYAFRPRLSSRLTLGGLAFPRKPRALGGGVARASLATRASILTSGRSTGPRRPRFAAPGKLPYRQGLLSSVPPLRLTA